MKNIKPADIILFKPGGDLFSRVIAWGTKSAYSHVAICVSPEMSLAIEANTRGGVRAIDLRKIKREFDIYRIKEDYGFNLEGAISFLVAQLNNRYDFLGVIYLGILKFIGIILRKPLKQVANKWQKKRDYFCSELCYEAFYKGAGLDIVPDVDEAEITSPGDIAKSIVVEKV
ncbi:MAG: hypothetical protein P9L96_04715 [Candidatus Gygaella obscura]|nr:hypothetical protein [Candidatus Gygaella obscura]